MSFESEVTSLMRTTNSRQLCFVSWTTNVATEFNKLQLLQTLVQRQGNSLELIRTIYQRDSTPLIMIFRITQPSN